MRKVHFAAALASALVLSTPASAGFFDFTLAPYIGAGAGQSRFDTDCATGLSCDDSDSAWKVYGGLEMNEYISMEAGYVDLGKARASVPGFAGAADIEVNGPTVQMVGTFVVSPSFTFLGKGGFGILHTEVDGAGFARQDTDLEWMLGLGAQYNFTKSLGMRAEWERYFNVGDRSETGDINIDLLTVGLVFKF